MSQTPAEEDLSLRAEAGRIFRLALPITVAQVGMMGLHLVDTAIVGRSSVENLAGVALGRSISFLTVAAALGLPISLEALATQAVGAREYATAFGALRAAIKVSFIAWFPITLLSFAVLLVLPRLGVEAPVVDRAFYFLLGNAPGNFGFVVFLAAKTYLQAHGRTMPALYAAVAANVVNFIVCSLLVRGDAALAVVHLPAMGLPTLGALGAGISASISALLLGGIVLWFAYAAKPPGPIPVVPVARVAKLGVPIGLQLLAEIGVFSVVALVAGRLGSRVISAHQIAIALASTTFMAALGVSGATAVRVGAAVGAGRSPRRSGFIGIGLGICIMSFGALTFLLIPSQLASLFTDDREVIETTVALLRIAAVFQLFDATQGVSAGALRGAGDVRFPFLVMLVGYWAIAFPLSLVLGFGVGWGAQGLWWGLSAGLGIVAALLLWRFAAISRHDIARV